MSESMTVEQKMARSVETWRKCDPILMASQSQAALTFAFRDMKRDILVLADEVERLRNAEKSLATFSGDVLGSADSVIQRLSEERDELRRRVAEMERQNDELAAKLKLVIDCGDSCCDEYCKGEWELAVNAAADKTLAKLKAEAVREAVEWLNFNYQHLSSPVCGLLTYYANQIEREGGV